MEKKLPDTTAAVGEQTSTVGYRTPYVTQAHVKECDVLGEHDYYFRLTVAVLARS